MKVMIGPALLIAAFAWTLAANAQSATPGPTAIPSAPASPPSASSAPVVFPLPGASTTLPTPAAPASSAPGQPSAAPVPTSSAIPASRAHLHRPGTDVDGDLLTGSLASQVYVIKGNVTLHSDPKIDREVADVSESDAPLTLTADEIDMDRLGTAYVAKGHVHFVQGSRSGHADTAMLNEETHSLDLVGNADVLDGDHRAAAAKMHYDMFGKQFLGSGNVRIYEPVPTSNPNLSATPAPKRKRRLPL